MAVGQYGRQAGALVALAHQEGPARLGVAQHPAAEAERLERRLHLGFDIARELGRALGILALGRDRDPAGEVGLEAAGVEIIGGAGNGGISAHTALVRFTPPYDAAVMRMTSDAL